MALWDGLIGIDWREPTYGGTAPITDFVIQFRSGNAGRWITANDGISTETFGLVSDLTNGTEYFFRVAAVNSVGTGAWSNVLSDTPYDFDPYNFDANGNQGTRWLYWNKPNFPDTPGNTLYQLGVLVNGTGNVQTTNKSTSTAGWNTFSESLMVNRIFPLKETGYSFIVSLTKEGSKTGNGSNSMLSVYPNCCHNSSQK